MRNLIRALIVACISLTSCSTEKEIDLKKEEVKKQNIEQIDYKIEQEKVSIKDIENIKIDEDIQKFIEGLSLTFDKKTIQDKTIIIPSPNKENWDKLKGNSFIGNYITDVVNNIENIKIDYQGFTIFLEKDKKTINHIEGNESLNESYKGKNILEMFRTLLNK